MNTHDEQGSKVQNDDYVAALIAGDAVADVVIDSLPEIDIALIASHPDITWPVLAGQPDRDAAIRLLEHRIQCAFLEGDDEPVIEALESPELVRDASSEPALMQLAMRSVTALAWTEPRIAMSIYRRYYNPDMLDEEGGALYAMCQRVLSIAPAWRRLENQCRVPRPLIRFIRLQWVVSADVLDRLIRTLRRDMTTRPQVYLDVCDCMAAHHEPLLRFLGILTERFLPPAVPSLGELGEDERRRLDLAMDAIDKPMRRGLRLPHLLASVITVGALLSIGGFDLAALAVMVVLGSLAAAYSNWSQRGLYGRRVRPLLAEYLVDMGTPTGCVVSWLLVNGKAVKRIKSFDGAIDADESLDLLARLGRMARLRCGTAGRLGESSA